MFIIAFDSVMTLNIFIMLQITAREIDDIDGRSVAWKMCVDLRNCNP